MTVHATPDPGKPAAGRKVPPGETPPAESGTTAATGPRGDLSRGWGAAPLVVLVLLAALFAAFFLVYAVLLDL
jgi:hypothetical protein